MLRANPQSPIPNPQSPSQSLLADDTRKHVIGIALVQIPVIFLKYPPACGAVAASTELALLKSHRITRHDL
jgi:hypothetical protein